MPKLIPFPHHYLGTTYLLIEGDKAIAFDMGIPFPQIQKYLSSHNLQLAAIYLTHGHYDHISGLKGLDKDVPIYLSSAEIDYLTDPELNLDTGMFGAPLTLPNIQPKLLEDGEELSFAGHRFSVIHTPFHTPGSLCFYFPDDKLLFSGDTLFRLSVGRSDLPGSCPRFMDASLAKLKRLPRETLVFPGHGDRSQLGFEFDHNPFLK